MDELLQDIEGMASEVAQMELSPRPGEENMDGELLEGTHLFSTFPIILIPPPPLVPPLYDVTITLLLLPLFSVCSVLTPQTDFCTKHSALNLT